MTIIDTLADHRLAGLLNQGAIGILPTDTIYGIVARAADQQAVGRLYDVKHREGKPGTIIAAGLVQLVQLGIAQRYLDVVAHLWPASLSIVLPAEDELAYLHQGMDSLAVRIPADPEITALLQQTGPLLTSSANLPGEMPARNLTEAQAYFQEKVDFYVAGDTIGKEPSTIARLNKDGSIEVLRQGAAHIN